MLISHFDYLFKQEALFFCIIYSLTYILILYILILYILILYILLLYILYILILTYSHTYILTYFATGSSTDV